MRDQQERNNRRQCHGTINFDLPVLVGQMPDETRGKQGRSTAGKVNDQNAGLRDLNVIDGIYGDVGDYREPRKNE